MASEFSTLLEPVAPVESKSEFTSLLEPEIPKSLGLKEPSQTPDLTGKTSIPLLDINQFGVGFSPIPILRRFGRQLYNDAIAKTLHTLGKSDMTSLDIEAHNIQKQRMKERKGEGINQNEALLTDELNDIKTQLTQKPETRESADVAKVARVFAEPKADVNPFEVKVPPAKNVAEKIVDVGAGITAFIAQLAATRNLAPAGTPEPAIWEIQSLANGGRPGEGAAMYALYSTPEKILSGWKPTTKIGSLGKGVAETVSQSVLFGGQAAMGGGSTTDILISAGVPFGFTALRFMKQGKTEEAVASAKEYNPNVSKMTDTQIADTLEKTIKIADKEQPSRKDFEQLGIRKLNAEQRRQASIRLRDALVESQTVVTPFEPTLATKTGEIATEAKPETLTPISEQTPVIEPKIEAKPIIKPKITATGKPVKSTGLKPFNAEEYVKQQTAKREMARTGELTGIVDIAQNLYKDAKRKLVDFAAPIEDVLRTEQKNKGYKILPTSDITNQIDKVSRSPTMAGQFARDNGLSDVIKNVDNLDNLDQYMIAKQVQDVEARGIKTGRDLTKDAMLIKEFAPRYEETAKIVNAYSQKLLDYATESGLISPDLATALKKRYPNYVPINRIFNELEKSGMSGTKAVASLSTQTVVQKLVGSERQIESPITSLLAKTETAFRQGEKNKAGKMLASYQGLPDNPFQLRELKKGESAIHTISFLDNGIKRTFETTPEIATAAKCLDVQQLGLLGRILALPVRLAKVGITGINLPFIASNIAKDQVTGIINSKDVLHTSIANPAIFIKSLFEAVKHGDTYDEMARNGAISTSFDIARNQESLSVKQIRAEKNPVSKILYTAIRPSELLRAIENIVGRSEELTRIQQYKGTKQAELGRGRTETDAQILASRAARENTVNFTRRGEWGKVLNSTFLYINANIQGTRTFVRNLSQRPVQTAAKMALAVFVPVAITTAWNLSDDKRRKCYEDISEFEKENNIIIVPPNPTKNADGRWNVIKIPLSQEINNIASMARRPIEQAYGLNPVSVEDITKAFVGTISPINPTVGSIASSLTPQAIRPAIEAYANKNFFTGTPQVSQGLEGLSPDLQVKPNTSGTARLMADPLNVSPIKVEEFIKSTLGGVGAQIINANDRALAAMEVIPKDQIGGQDTVKAILARFATAKGDQNERNFYDNFSIINMQMASYRKYVKSGMTAKADTLLNEHPEIGIHKGLAQTAEAIKKTKLLINEITASTDKSDTEKKQLIDQAEQNIQLRITMANEAVKKIQKNKGLK